MAQRRTRQPTNPHANHKPIPQKPSNLTNPIRERNLHHPPRHFLPRQRIAQAPPPRPILSPS